MHAALPSLPPCHYSAELDVDDRRPQGGVLARRTKGSAAPSEAVPASAAATTLPVNQQNGRRPGSAAAAGTAAAAGRFALAAHAQQLPWASWMLLALTTPAVGAGQAQLLRRRLQLLAEGAAHLGAPSTPWPLQPFAGGS